MKIWTNNHIVLRWCACIVFFMAHSLISFSQTDSLLHSVYSHYAKLLGWGKIDVLDTYLSPESYKGASLLYISDKISTQPYSIYSFRYLQQLTFANIYNRSQNASELYGMYQIGYGFYRNWALYNRKLHICTGILLHGYLGAIYNAHNSNNPVQVKVGIQLSPSAMASYQFHIWHYPITVGYQVAMPVIGATFSPQYGQSYYEIFCRGNYDHNVVTTSVGNTPCIHQMVTADFPLKHIFLRVGYMNDVQQYKVNQLKYHSYTHSFVVGIVKHLKLTTVRP